MSDPADFCNYQTDPDEFVFWVAESVSERIALRLHPPEQPGFRAASWRAQYQLLRGIEPAWADAWLTATRSALTAAGADRAVLDLLPAPS
ncbi:Imm63 family immunity protein [Rhodococcus sp. NPDC057014]|uniref:Imm63 family immunity protein n=1 Tax=Rhodococcus sp. NPDC057014 TaxID=3346000 RepID=UPI00362EA9DA